MFLPLDITYTINAKVLVHGMEMTEDTMEALATLKHHRKTDNRYSFGFGRQTITVTRRFLADRSVRVRVTSSTFSGKGEGNWTDFRDYTDMHEGDTAYSKQAQNFCAKWEERYCSTPSDKKEAAPVSEPTQDNERQPTATQWAAGATMTPAKAAELATRRTGVQHVVSQDGRIVRRAPQAPDTIEHQVPANAPVTLNARGLAALPGDVVEGKVVGRLLGEWTLKVKGRRMGRSDAMLLLLQAQTKTLHESEMATHALRSTAKATPEMVEYTADLQVKAMFFRALRDAGYAADSTWDELIEMLRPVVSTALFGLDNQRVALELADASGQRSVRRIIGAAETFLTACAPVLLSFFGDDEEL